MIRKGVTGKAALVLENRAGAVSASGDSRARLGYRLGSDDGVWADWDWSEGRLELRTDRLGFYPLFYFEDGPRFAVATGVEALLAAGAPPALDDAALAVFLRLGFFLGDDTPFLAIRAVPPGASLSWDRRGLSLESQPPGLESDGGSWSRAQAVTRFGEAFQESLRAFTLEDSERVALPLSGGRDSRHILLGLLRSGRPPAACVTMAPLPPRSHEDAAIASLVARFAGLPHAELPAAEDLLDAEREKNRLTSFCADEHAWILPLRAHLAREGFTAVFDGIGGDVLSAGMRLTERRLSLYRQNRFEELAEELLGPEAQLPRMLRPAAYARWSRALAVERLIPELRRHRDAPNPVGQFFFWNRTRREIAASPWGLLNEGRQVYAPFLAAPVRSLLSGLPAEYFLDHSFHTEAIAAFYPEAAGLPYEAAGARPTRSARARIARYGRQFARRCLLAAPARELLEPSFFLPRIVKGLLDADYGSAFHFLFNKAVYLTQLAEAAPRPRPSRSAAEAR